MSHQPPPPDRDPTPPESDAATSLTHAAQRAHHMFGDPHSRSRAIPEVVLGAQDGLVNTLGAVLAMAAASGQARVVFAAAMGTAFAESISMAAVGYTSSVARGDIYRAERAREYRHLQTSPQIERDEIRAIYIKKGFDGDLLDRVVNTICSNRDIWVAVMMAEEHELVATSRASSLRSAGVIGLSSFAGAALPVIPFAYLSLAPSVVVSLSACALALFALGAHKAAMTLGPRIRNGIELCAIGMLSALASYAVGRFLSPQS